MSTVKQSFVGSILLIVDSLFKKSVGLISTLILARVLLPEDFGIIAIATLMMGFLNVFTQTGMTQYIVRSDNPDDNLLNTAFSLNLMIRLVLTVLLFFAAYPIADYYDDPRLVALLQVYSSLLTIGGLANPAVNLLRRKQQYGKIVKMTMAVKVFSTISAVSVALIFESYWAMAVGQFMSITLTAIAGYFIYPYMPKLRLANLREQWRYSGWLIPQSLLGYCRTQFDTIMISDMFGQDKLGSYHTMKYLAFIPNSEFILPATEPLLAQMAPLRNNPTHFNSRYTIATIVTMALAIPAAMFLFFHSYSVVAVLLGKNWIEQHQLFAWFALIIPAYAMYHNANRTFLIFAKTQFTLFYEIICATVIVSVLLIFTFDTILDLAKIKSSIELVLSAIYFCFAALRYTNWRYTSINIICTVSLVAVCIGLGSITSSYINFASPLLTLLAAGICFASAYALICIGFILVTRKSFFVSEYLYSLLHKALVNLSGSLRKSNG